MLQSVLARKDGLSGQHWGHSRQHAGRGRYQHRCLTLVTDDAPRDGWVLQTELHEKWLKFTEEWRGALGPFGSTALQNPQHLSHSNSNHIESWVCLYQVYQKPDFTACCKTGTYGEEVIWPELISWEEAEMEKGSDKSGEKDKKWKKRQQGEKWVCLTHPQPKSGQ